MVGPEKDTFVVALSASALFDMRESDAVFQAEQEAGFIRYQIANEDKILRAGSAMPVAKALLAAQAILKDAPKVKLLVMSHNHPSASPRVMRSAAEHKLPIERASFVGGDALGPYLLAERVDLFLSCNERDVRAALHDGIAAAMLVDCAEEYNLEEDELRVAFDFDSVLASDTSERFFHEHPAEYFRHEAELKKVPLEPGPFAPILRWMSLLQKAVKASGAHFRVRTAVVTARNQAAMERVIYTMRDWGVDVDQAHFLGRDPKDAILRAFRPHIFFDDQLKNVTGAVPGGHVPYGFKNEGNKATPSPAPAASTGRIPLPVPSATVSEQLVANAASQLEQVTKLSKKEFEVQCRAIFRSYTPLARHTSSLDERFRVFLATNSSRTAEERGKIVAALKRYDLSDIKGHDPVLNRELGDIVLNKLEKVVMGALGPKQQSLQLG
jgi:5'-nucleotidase